MKHLSSRGRKRRPIWPLYVLAGIAVVLAVLALIKTVGVLDIFGDKATEPTAAASTAPTAPITQPPDEARLRAELLAECRALVDGYFYEEAISALSTMPYKNAETDALLQEAQGLKDGLVLYEDEQLYHIFFHSLIIDNAKAFDGDQRAQGYNEYMTTRYEFERMLPLLLEGGFVLYDIKEMVEFTDGVASRKEIRLPPGKKPLVISIDDVCYYDYMETDGFASRLDVDADGNVVTIVKDDDGTERATYDGDVMPILDAFVREHPEFSWRGYKGIVAVTGYQGAYGYRITDLDQFDAETGKKMQDKVLEISNALRATGWDVACHSYTHNQYWTKGTISEEQFNKYEKRWDEEMAPYLGEVSIFISPNGAYANLGKNHWAIRRLVESGYVIYCPVGSGMQTSYQGDFMLQDRMNLDGLNLVLYPERVKKFFFDPSLVVDPDRPPF